MKKLTKATALILSAIMLFGCADSTQSKASGTAQSSESSATENKTDSNDTSIDTSIDIISDTSSSETSKDTRNYNLVESKEGYQTFSYDPEKYEMVNYREYIGSALGHYTIYDYYKGYLPFDPTPEGLKEHYRPTFEPIAIKCHVAGDSYYFKRGRCGKVKIKSDVAWTGLFTPVVIEEIIDTYDYECSFKEGDIIYVLDYYDITDPCNELTVEEINYRLSKIKRYFEDESGNFDSSKDYLNENYKIYYNKSLEYYDMILSGNGKYIENDWAPVILQKGQSYLIFLNNKDNTPNEVDGNIYNNSYPVAFDLENDEPTVFKSKEIDEEIFYFGKCYPYQWKYLKEKYGEHFKN